MCCCDNSVFSCAVRNCVRPWVNKHEPLRHRSIQSRVRWCGASAFGVSGGSGAIGSVFVAVEPDRLVIGVIAGKIKGFSALALL